MLYVLANPAGSLYLHDRGGVFHNSSLMPGPPDRRRAGASVLVFEGSALADRYLVRHALFGDDFRTRPARPGDLLGGSVCRASWGADGGYEYDVVPTPADAAQDPTADGDRDQMPDDGGPNPPAEGTAVPLVCPDCGKAFTPALGDLALDRPPDPGGSPGPGQLTVRCPHCGATRAVRWGERRPPG